MLDVTTECEEKIRGCAFAFNKVIADILQIFSGYHKSNQSFRTTLPCDIIFQ